MRIAPLIALPAVAVAQAGMMDKFNDWANNMKAQVMATLPNALDAGAAAVAAQVVQPINMRNWKVYLWPQENQPEEWLLYITGGNKTCFGRCDHVDRMWNQSVPQLTALASPPGAPKLRLGSLDCESNEILCTSWSASTPSIWHFYPSTAPGKTTDLRVIRLSVNTTETKDIISIPSTSESGYLKHEPYEGMMHPIDGTLQKFGLATPFGFLLWGLGAVPSWVMMLVISFASRTMMNRRINDNPAMRAGQPGQAAPAGAAPAAGAAPPAAPRSPAGKGSSKKKR